MAVTLDRAVEASEIVDALKPFGVTQVDVAAVIQVSDRAVRGWRTGDIRPERYDRLAQLRDLVLLLSDSLTPRGVGQWLHAKNRLLDGQRPVDLLAKDRYEDVRSAAEICCGLHRWASSSAISSQRSGFLSIRRR